jgi:hypothetical protein
MQALQQYSYASATTIFRYTTEDGKQRKSRADVILRWARSYGRFFGAKGGHGRFWRNSLVIPENRTIEVG